MKECELFEGNNLYQGSKLIGYSRSRDQGEFIIIVVDDYFKSVIKDRAPTAHAFGLKEIWNEACQLDNVRAIGFFNLPQRCDLDEIQDIVAAIKLWSADVSNSTCKFYLLIDYFSGLETIDTYPPGMKFADYWIEKGPFPAKVAHLTIGAAAELPNPHKLKLFIKTDISGSQKLPLELLEWLDAIDSPLEKLWHNTARWFSSDDDHLLMKHSFDSIQQDFLSDEQSSKYRANKYKKYVQNELGVTFPDIWWCDPKSVRSIHESLKCLCGAYFCGQTKDPARRHISIGAAYLIALMAHQKACNDITGLIQESTWNDCSQATSPLFPLQDIHTARSSAIALYDFFFNMFNFRQETKSPVKNAFFDHSGKLLQIQLNWRADKCADDRQDSLAKNLTQIVDQDEIQIPENSGNTKSAILRLWRSMAISENGFMGPGVIYIEGDKLVIASTK